MALNQAPIEMLLGNHRSGALENAPAKPGDPASTRRQRRPPGLNSTCPFPQRHYFVEASGLRLLFRIFATTPTLRSATSEILYSMEVPKTEAASALVNL
jgi:hypothetical protein